jgi:hypothetical protein
MVSMRRFLAVLAAVVFLIAMAPNAFAADPDFRGRYRATWREIDGYECGNPGFQYNVRIRRISATRLWYRPEADYWGARLRYRSGEQFPWQHRSWESAMIFRYRPSTNTAIGEIWGEGCGWRGRLVPRN